MGRSRLEKAIIRACVIDQTAHVLADLGQTCEGALGLESSFELVIICDNDSMVLTQNVDGCRKQELSGAY